MHSTTVILLAVVVTVALIKTAEAVNCWHCDDGLNCIRETGCTHCQRKRYKVEYRAVVKPNQAVNRVCVRDSKIPRGIKMTGHCDDFDHHGLHVPNCVCNQDYCNHGTRTVVTSVALLITCLFARVLM